MPRSEGLKTRVTRREVEADYVSHAVPDHDWLRQTEALAESHAGSSENVLMA